MHSTTAAAAAAPAAAAVAAAPVAAVAPMQLPGAAPPSDAELDRLESMVTDDSGAPPRKAAPYAAAPAAAAAAASAPAVKPAKKMQSMMTSAMSMRNLAAVGAASSRVGGAQQRDVLSADLEYRCVVFRLPAPPAHPPR